MRRLAAAAMVLGLCACSPSAPAPTPEAAAPAAVATEPAAPPEPTAADFAGRFKAAVASAIADTSTPEAALKAWWSAGEALSALSCEADVHERKLREAWDEGRYAAISDVYGGVFAGEAADYFQASLKRSRESACIVRIYRREIQSTKMTGETNAVIVVATHNATPLPEGFELDQYNRQRRRDGSRFRYTLVKEDAGWRIEKIEENPFLKGWSSRTSTIFQLEGIPYTDTIP